MPGGGKSLYYNHLTHRPSHVYGVHNVWYRVKCWYRVVGADLSTKANVRILDSEKNYKIGARGQYQSSTYQRLFRGYVLACTSVTVVQYILTVSGL